MISGLGSLPVQVQNLHSVVQQGKLPGFVTRAESESLSAGERATFDLAARVHGGDSIINQSVRERVFPEAVVPVMLPESASLTDARQSVERAIIAGQDLTVVEEDLARRFGESSARSILHAALDASELDGGDAHRWLQSRREQENPRWLQIEAILREFEDGTRLVDLNENGKLDASDAVMRTVDGTLEIQRISESMRNRVRLGVAYLDAAHALTAAGPGFDLVDSHRFHDLYWQPATHEPVFATFETREGVRSSEALLDILLNTEFYGYECKTGQIVLTYMAILTAIGPEDFDAAFPRLRLGPQEHARWSFAPAALGVKDLLQTQGRGLLPNPDAPAPRPGDAVYFQNWDVSPASADAGWSGENTVYLGQGMYYGHPFGIVTADQIISYLNDEPKVGARRSAAMTPKRTTLRDEFFDLDRTPSD